MGRRRQGRRGERMPKPATKGDRSCIGCRTRRPRVELVRVVRATDGVVHVDRFLKAPGRGAHLCYEPACVVEAIRRGAFQRAFKEPVLPVSAEEIIPAICAGIEARIDAALALGRRSGGCVSGTDVIDREMRRTRLLILATDVAENTKARLVRRAVATSSPTYVYKTADILGKSQGKSRRVAIAVTDRALANRLVAEFERRSRVLVAT